MNRLKILVLASTLGGAALSCGGGTGPDLPNIVGSWHATTIQVTNKANSAQTTNLITLGVTIQVVLNANLSFTATFSAPGQAPDVSTGTYVQTATTLTLTDNTASGGEVNAFTYTLSSSTLTLSGGSLDFDFGSGEVPVRLDVTLVH